jgi:hypothetical protein
MPRRPRTYYTDTQKALMWERWKKGETLHQIAKLFDRPHTSIRQIPGRVAWDPASRALPMQAGP